VWGGSTLRMEDEEANGVDIGEGEGVPGLHASSPKVQKMMEKNRKRGNQEGSAEHRVRDLYEDYIHLGTLS